MSWICRVILTLLGCIGTLQAAERPLRFAVADSWSMPLIHFDAQGHADNGILKDLLDRLAQRAQVPHDLVRMPRRRVQQAVEHGDIDVRCYVNPAWLSESHYLYIWSLPILTQRNIMVTRHASMAPLPPEKLPPGTRIGTVLGYSYPRLEPLFASGRLLREDARTQELAMAMLRAGRFDYAMTDQMSLDWFNRDLPRLQRLQEVAEIAREDVSCLVRDTPQIPTMALLRALVRMKMAGEFEQIITRYR